MNYYSPYQFAIFRIIFGIYLFAHFLLLIPQTTTHTKIGSSYTLLSYIPLQLFLAMLMVCALFFTCGVWRKAAALLLFLSYYYLIVTNILVSNGVFCVGIILLACTLVPAKEPLVLGERAQNNWRMPAWLLFSAWILLVSIYSIDGFRIVRHLLWSSSPSSIMRIFSWCYATLELTFGIFCLFSSTRAWAWLLMLFMNIISLIANFHVEFAAHILLLQLFVLNIRWLKPRTFVENPIVFFDGHCGLCNWFINFAITEDQAGILLFSPLQGETAKATIGFIEIDKLESVILYDNKKLYRQSAAMLRILGYVGGLGRLIEFARYLPARFLNGVYHIVAAHRYQWFGKRDVCRIPSQNEKHLFLP